MVVPKRPRKVPIAGQLDLQRHPIVAIELPDKIPVGVHTLLVGYGPGADSAATGHYYPGGGNYMWKLAYQSGLSEQKLNWTGDDDLVRLGFGFTDVVKRPTIGPITSTPAERFAARKRLDDVVARHRPKWVAFVGLESVRTYLRKPSKGLGYGKQDFMVGGAKVFILPSTSGASTASTSWEEKLRWFEEFREALRNDGILGNQSYTPA